MVDLEKLFKNYKALAPARSKPPERAVRLSFFQLRGVGFQAETVLKKFNLFVQSRKGKKWLDNFVAGTAASGVPLVLTFNLYVELKFLVLLFLFFF